MKILAPSRNTGITVIELFLAMAAVLIFTAFVSPIWSFVSGGTDLERAVEQVEATLSSARESTQVFRTDVVVHLHTDPLAPNALSFSVPSLNNLHQYLESDNQMFALPETIRMTADQPVIRFNTDGKVEVPIQLTLASTIDENQVKLVQVE
jgi:Tfp pilus assembly protein FimT